LRIDDTDRERHVTDAIAKILEGFRWIGMDWDEGPEVGGAYGPYQQSERGAIYRGAAEQLIASGRVYRDYTTEAERTAERQAAESAKRAYRFRRPEYTAEQLRSFEAEGRPYALRFEVPSGRSVVVHDLIKGEVVQQSEEIGDFVIVRPDGTPLYNFASVVDDVAMRISHVIRAEEHLPNTFSQVLLFEALGAEMPAFAHVPYVAEPGSRKKMSKRKMEEYAKKGILLYLHDYIERGYLPEALMNYLSRLGWSYDDTQELFSRSELIEKFSLERVNSSPASHDQDKLFWIEGEWMKLLPLEQKVEGVIPFLAREGLITPPASDVERQRIGEVLIALGDRLKTFSDILKLGKFFFQDDVEYDPDAVKKRLKGPQVIPLLREMQELLIEVEHFDPATLEAAVHAYGERTGRKMGDVVNPLRVAVTGQAVGPGLYDCLVILGRDACIARLGRAIAHVEGKG
jgi:glutamyl-tRNA synthetase